MKKLIILFGAPGSGKGLIGDKLVEKTGISKFSTGDFFRLAVKKGSPIGQAIAEDVLQGKLLKDFLANFVVKDILVATQGDIILDGYPRTRSQFSFLQKLIKNEYIPLCVHVDTNVEDIVFRINQRRICEDCGTTHFASQNCCPRCGGRSVLREDDKLIKERMDQYFKITAPILEERIKPWCHVVRVNGMNIDESVAKVLDALKNI